MTIQDDDRFSKRMQQENGFILLEVLVAMSLIMGSWMAATHAYQKLTLVLKQQESKRSQLRREFDAYEIESIRNDAARVSSRNHPLRTSTKPFAKGKRSLGSQASGV